MNKETTNTNQTNNAQPSLCAAISKKLWLRLPKAHGEKKDPSPVTGQENVANTDERSEKPKGKRKDTLDEIKTVLKKLRKISALLPKVSQSSYAYETGGKNCETCNMDKEEYKLLINSVKIVELIAIEAINKEKNEMLDKDDQEIKTDNGGKFDKKEQKKQLKLCEEVFQHNFDHNLKCELVKLQKVIGLLLLQVCYCKSNQNPDNAKCKTYDLPINVLEHLKFEYANLITNSIIRLCKAPSKQKIQPDICLACMKEEIADCTEMLKNILKNGRNLKVTMRNDDKEQDQCCSRNYPHVHAFFHNRYVVLKFERPFEVAPSGKADNKSVDKENQRSEYENEWHSHFDPESDEESLSKRESKEVKNLADDLTGKGKSPLNKHGSGKDQLQSTLANRSIIEPSISAFSCATTSGKGQPGSQPLGRATSEKGKPATSFQSLTSNSGKERSLESQITRDGLKSLIKSKSKSSVHHSYSILTSEEPTDKDEMYCGCNFNEIYEKLGICRNVNEALNLETRKNEPEIILSQDLETSSQKSNVYLNKGQSINSQKQKSTKKSYSESEDSMMSLSNESIKSDFDLKKHKNISSTSDEKQIFYMGNPNYQIFQTGEIKPHLMLQKQPHNQDKWSNSSKSRTKSNIEKEYESDISAVDSKKLINLEEPKQYFSSKSLISPALPKQTFNTDIKNTDLESNSSKCFDKQQINVVLKDLGASKLLSAISPVENCKYTVGLLENDFNCIPDVPFSVSLDSLPLDEEDLNFITQAVELVKLGKTGFKQ